MDMKAAKQTLVAVKSRDAAVATNSLHTLPILPYGYAELEPYIDARTLTLHHDKHHKSYVDKLNAALEPYSELHPRSARWLLVNSDAVPEAIRTTVLENAGGHVNHSLLWDVRCPAGDNRPTGSLLTALELAFGSVDQFKARFEEAGSHLFGSGWVWLVVAHPIKPGETGLEIMTTSNHDNPTPYGKFPLLVNDAWEHAYYLQYENRRPEYLKRWWSVVNWKAVVQRFEHPKEFYLLASSNQ